MENTRDAQVKMLHSLIDATETGSIDLIEIRFNDNSSEDNRKRVVRPDMLNEEQLNGVTTGIEELSLETFAVEDIQDINKINKPTKVVLPTGIQLDTNRYSFGGVSGYEDQVWMIERSDDRDPDDGESWIPFEFVKGTVITQRKTNI